MFDPKKWIKEKWNQNDTEKTICIADEEIQIRRLKGTQWERYLQAMTSKKESAVALVLQMGLVKEYGSHSYEDMVKFYDACPVFADRIAAEIITLTTDCLKTENDVLEGAEKNSETTTSPLLSGDGVVSTDKTHRKPK